MYIPPMMVWRSCCPRAESWEPPGGTAGPGWKFTLNRLGYNSYTFFRNMDVERNRILQNIHQSIRNGIISNCVWGVGVGGRKYQIIMWLQTVSSVESAWRVKDKFNIEYQIRVIYSVEPNLTLSSNKSESNIIMQIFINCC